MADFILGQHAVGCLGLCKDPLHGAFVGREAAPLEPEHDIRFAGHRADFDLLLAPDDARRDAGVHRVHQVAIVLAKGFDDRGRVNAGGSSKGVPADDRIIRRDRHAGRVRNNAAVLADRRQITFEVSHQHQVDEQGIHRRVADALADADRGAVQARRAGVERRQRVTDRKVAVAVAVPVDADASPALFDHLRHEPDHGGGTRGGGVAHGIRDAHS